MELYKKLYLELKAHWNTVSKPQSPIPRSLDNPISNSTRILNMLSNPNPSLQQRHRLHRRQNSTPTAFEAMKVPNLPAQALQRRQSHRRGQSLDQRSPQRQQSLQGDQSVSITNQGSQSYQQHILRETQQQRLAPPGQQQGRQQSTISPGPQCGNQTFFQQSNNGMQCMPSSLYNNTNQMSDNVISGNQQGGNGQDFYQFELPLSAGYQDGFGLGLDENMGSHYFQQDHRVMYPASVSGAPEDARRMSQPELRTLAQRPVTPNQQFNPNHLPLTPATTPFRKMAQLVTQPRVARSVQSSPIKPRGDETIRASQSSSMQRGRSLEGVFGDHSNHGMVPSPPNTAPLVQASQFDSAVMPTPGTVEYSNMIMDAAFSDTDDVSSYNSPASHMQSPTMSAYKHLSGGGARNFFNDNGGLSASSSMPMLSTSHSGMSLNTVASSPIRGALSPRAASISDLNLEPGINASIEDTGVTIDDIAAFIEGPDPVDNRWACRYDGCNKKFGRKENIKSHVQTHLGDRQFRCDHCNKCFVRGHDLKRHAKIHSGAKPYPCLCGNAFARHDALTRHRQRGMCIGAFDGVVKKVIKRGRPRKHRPDMEERTDKAARTRQRVNNQTYASSSSGSSESSFQSPFTDVLDSMSLRGSSPFGEDMPLFGQATDSTCLPPDFFTFTPPASPGYSTGNKPSPIRSHRSLSPAEFGSPSKPMLMDIPEELPTIPSSPTPVKSHHNSPPSLCQSSSSPAPPRSFDLDEGSNQDAIQMMNELLGTNMAEESKPRVAMLPGTSMQKERIMSGSEFVNFGDEDDSFFGLDYEGGMSNGAADNFFDLQ